MSNRIKLLIAELFHKLNYNSSSKSSVETEEKKILKGLKKEGYYVINSFLDAEECNALRKKTDSFLIENINYVKLESNGQDKRVYGVDKYDSNFVISNVEKISDKIFSKFSFILNKNYFYLLGKIESGKENLGSGSGWHRDSPISNQFKTILYLSDVDENNGPFQYITGSHSYSSLLKTSKFLDEPLSKNRFSDQEIENLLDKNIVSQPKTFIAKAGTLIFVNTRGLHRGAPLREKNRYALTRYHFAKKNKSFA